MSLLDIRDLKVGIGGTPILHGVSLTLAPGKVLALIGESGSGKSMTALAVMGLLPEGAVAAGSVRLDGAERLGASERTLCQARGREMGMVFQEPMSALNPVQTIGRQVAEAARLRGTARRPAAALARAALDRVGLEAVPADRYPHELSGGQRQRVVTAIATALSPRLLIADEPTTALDVTTQAALLALLTGLARDEGIGLLFITHDLALAQGMADRIAVMEAGRIVETGPTARVFARPAHARTRALLAAARHRADLPRRATPETLLTVTGLGKTYPAPRKSLLGARPRRAVLEDITFTLHRGERLGIVGESGSGKSTLIRALLGLAPPERGTITLAGTPISQESARARVQVVFQDPYASFNPRHRVGRLIAEPLHRLGRAAPRGAARQAAVARALGDVGLPPEAARRHIHAFSGGQRQRIAIARALIADPDVVLFDEAVSALDPSVRAQILELIATLSRARDLSYVFVSHDLSVVRGITDRVLVMQTGRIVEDAATETLFAAPDHAYTRALIAAAPRLDPMEETPRCPDPSPS